MTTPSSALARPAAYRHRGAPARLAFLALVAAGAACHDAPTDPTVGLVAQESYAALALGAPFQAPEAWSGGKEMDPAAAAAAEAWSASWDFPPDEGRTTREGTYAPMARGLAGVMGSDVLRRELAALSDAVARAEALGGGGDFPGHVAAGIRAAATQRALAAEAEARGDRPAALEALMRGEDALREVGPEAVARALVGEVERRMGSLSGDRPYSEETLERLRRLARGGRRAVEEGDWVLAIRRAFYARGILDGNG